MDHQVPPAEDWRAWVILGGRGAGKTRAGAEWVRAQVEGPTALSPGRASRVALVGETYDQVRDVMIRGDSGILACSPPDRRPLWKASERRLIWPNGAEAQAFSAHDPEALRGPQFDAAWADELAKWKKGEDTWDMLQFALRLGEAPRQVITTTPRATRLIKSIINNKKTIIGRSKTSDNKTHLSKSFLKNVHEKYSGTRLGRQELEGELIEDREDALWQRDQIEHLRQRSSPDLERIVVAIDPPITSGEKADLCGIIAAGVDVKGAGFILQDQSVQGLTPLKWAEVAVELYHNCKADRIVAEVNQGGELVEAILRQVDSSIPIKKVHATRGKFTRAEPVAALYEQGRICHIGCLQELEDQMCDFGPGGLSSGNSPDRLDALVWAITDLMLNTAPVPRMRRL